MRIIITSIICLIPFTAGAQDKLSMKTTIRGKLKQDRNLEGGVWLLKSGGKQYDLHGNFEGFKTGDEVEIVGHEINGGCFHDVGRVFRAKRIRKTIFVDRQWSSRCRSNNTEIRDRKYLRITSSDEWKDVWASHGGTGKAPKVDFNEEMVVALFFGKCWEGAGAVHYLAIDLDGVLIGKGGIEIRLSVERTFLKYGCQSRGFWIGVLPKSPAPIKITTALPAQKELGQIERRADYGKALEEHKKGCKKWAHYGNSLRGHTEDLGLHKCTTCSKLVNRGKACCFRNTLCDSCARKAAVCKFCGDKVSQDH